MVRAVWWEGDGRRGEVVQVETVGEVEGLVARVVDRYRARVVGCVPGIELGEAPGGTLSIGVAGDRWALVVTGKGFDQWCSRSDDDDPDGSVDVFWEEPTPLPWHCFVPRATALAAVERWLVDRGLAPEVAWGTVE